MDYNGLSIVSPQYYPDDEEWNDFFSLWYQDYNLNTYITEHFHYLISHSDYLVMVQRPLNNDDFETFFKYYDKYSNEDKKIVIDLVKENFENFENLLLIIFHFDFRNFYEKQKGNSNDLIIFEKSDCIDSLSNIWKEETNSLLKKLKEDLNFEEISITKEKNNKTILIKISQEKEEDMIINDDIFKNAIILDD